MIPLPLILNQSLMSSLPSMKSSNTTQTIKKDFVAEFFNIFNMEEKMTTVFEKSLATVEVRNMLPIPSSETF